MTDNIAPKLSVEVVDAIYKASSDRYKGNPLIEALPEAPAKRSSFDDFVEYLPPKPTELTRRRSEMTRLMEAMTLTDLVYEFPEYSKACVEMSIFMREAYVSRNPLKAVDVQRRHALACGQRDGVLRPKNWKSHAGGYFIVAVTGMGKTTLIESFLLRCPQVIRHKLYHGIRVPTQYQIVYLYLRVPHNGTLSALCLQFFRKVDAILGTDYTRQARGIRSIAPMVELMNRVATAVSISFIVVDEVQSLRNARSEHADIALNYFSEIIEGLGIGVICLATPAVDKVLEEKVRSIRKLSSNGLVLLQPMRARDPENMSKPDPQWKTFCEICWDYTYVQKKARLDAALLDCWHKISAGNTAFAMSAFLLTQRNEIGGREIVDIDALQRTASRDMAFLKPAIAALNSGNEDQLARFDDLLYGARYRRIQRLLGVEEAENSDCFKEVPEFEEVDEAIAKSEKNRKRISPRQSPPNWNYEIPTRDPLVL